MDMRTTLLDQAELLARTRGFDAFSFADLARHAKIAKPSVHHHFATKAKLSEALIVRYTAQVAGALDEIAETSASPRRCLERFVDLYRDSAREGEALCLCVAFSAGRDSLSEDVRDALGTFHTGVLGWLRAALEAHGRSGKEAESVLALVEGAQLMARSTQDIRRYDAATAPFLASLKREE
ncbi:TetR/AcrR family transcriptional regulator [Pseudaestuariivita sp.]|uniref:TetR/AcrR family transcriptional regulator n=1 Tax=Pseudaestuariivita sp. TaxID=2211669 RepID=UPI004057F665